MKLKIRCYIVSADNMTAFYSLFKHAAKMYDSSNSFKNIHVYQHEGKGQFMTIHC